MQQQRYTTQQLFDYGVFLANMSYNMRLKTFLLTEDHWIFGNEGELVMIERDTVLLDQIEAAVAVYSGQHLPIGWTLQDGTTPFQFDEDDWSDVEFPDYSRPVNGLSDYQVEYSIRDLWNMMLEAAQMNAESGKPEGFQFEHMPDLALDQHRLARALLNPLFASAQAITITFPKDLTSPYRFSAGGMHYYLMGLVTEHAAKRSPFART